jgi:purine-binding chemotaxis protein CheW
VTDALTASDSADLELAGDSRDLDALHLLCRVGDATYALPAREVVELESYAGATAVPGTAPWVDGLVQIRGRVVPAVDLRARLGLPRAPRSLDTRIVVVELGDRVVGLVVDAAREVVRIDPDADGGDPVEAAPDAVDAAVVRGMVRAGERRFLLIDLASLLPGQELSHGGHR